MRKLYTFILSVFLVMGIGFCDVKAASYNEELDRVVDDADILTDSQEKELEERIDELIKDYKVDIVIVTKNYTSGSIESAADEFFDCGGYGYGSDYDGIIFYVDMGDRNAQIGTTGYGSEAFTDYGQDYIFDHVMDYMSDGEYYKCFDKFLDYCDDFLKQAEKGKPYDTYNKYRTKADIIFGVVIRVVVSLVIGLIAALIVCSSMKRAMSTVNVAHKATQYVGQSGLNLTNSNDIYLRNYVSKMAIQNNNSSGGSRGGTTLHRGSSGRMHGGSSRRF